MTYLAGFANVTAPIEYLRPFILALILIGFAMHALPPDLPERIERRLRPLPLAGPGRAGRRRPSRRSTPWARRAWRPIIYFQF